MPFDVGAIARELQSKFGLFADRDPHTGLAIPGSAEAKRNRATPEDLAVLLAALGALTDETYAKRQAMNHSPPDIGARTWDDAELAWSERLEEYLDAVSNAGPGDRQAVLWDVTAPLLIGYYGGEASTEPQRTLDAATPFILANALEVDEEWRDERWDLFLEDLEANAKGLVPELPPLLPIVVGFAGLVIIVGALRRRRQRA